MRLNDAVKTAWRGLSHSKMRSFLTMLGIIIGIASVILLMAIGKSAQKLIIGQVQGVGSNLIFVIPGATKGANTSPASVQGVVIKTLVKKDVEAMKREDSVLSAVPEVRGVGRVVFENVDTDVTYQGVPAEYFQVRNFEIEKGSFFSESDESSYNRVAVLGPEIAETLFGARNPVGKSVRLKGLSFRVVGVFKPEGVGVMGIDQDNLVMIPVTVAQKQLLGINHYNLLTVQVKDDYDVDFAKSRVISTLRQSHRITDPDKDDFTVRTQEDALELLGNITSVLTIFLTSIASISLVVGGIGIMNIMLVSVAERTREIGLRKALGATYGDILKQFLLESAMITFVGGAIGIIAGASLAGIAYLILSNVLATGWPFALPISSVLISAAVATATGIVFGLYPARKAALKSPIEALHYE